MAHLYSLILASFDAFFTAVDGFWVALPGPPFPLFLLLFLVTTRLRARSESLGLLSRFAESAMAQSLRDMTGTAGSHVALSNFRYGELGIK